MPPVDVDAAKAVVDEEPGKPDKKTAKTRKTDTIIVDDGVAGEKLGTGSSKKIDSDKSESKAQKQIPKDASSKYAPKKESQSEPVSNESQDDDFEIDMDSVAGSLEINPGKDDSTSEKPPIEKPQKKDHSDPFAEVIKSGSISILNNEDGIVEQSLNEAKRAEEDKKKSEAEAVQQVAQAGLNSKGKPASPALTTPPPVKKVKVGAIKGKTPREFSEVVPPPPPTPEPEPTQEIKSKETSESANYEFQPPNDPPSDPPADVVFEPAKDRPLPGDRRKDKSSIGIMLAAVAVVLIAVLAWWFITDRTGVEPTSGELPVAGIPQTMIDEVPQSDESEPSAGAEDEIVFDQDLTQEIEIDGASITVEEPTIEPVRSEPSTATQPSATQTSSADRFGLRGEAQPMDGRVFSIIVHSLPNRSEGNLQCNEIAALDLRCVVVEATANDQTTFRVGIGQFQTYAEAQRRVNDLPEPYRSRNFPARVN
ncbi:MAG: hypothetical protein LAT57_05815 [Balneolales bacterium]|nr:hypothetical protein [Balneolales bacterium]